MLRIVVQTYRPVGELDFSSSDGPFMVVHDKLYSPAETVSCAANIEPGHAEARAKELAASVGANVYTFAFFKRVIVPSLHS